MNPKLKLSQISGIGPFYVHKLAKLNIITVEDLIYHFPFRYDDFSAVSTALDAQEGQKVTLIGEIWSIKNIFTRGGRVLTQAVFNDGTTPINLTWFNSSWITKQLTVGDRVQLSGKLTKYKNKWTIVSPVWEKLTVIASGAKQSDPNSEIASSATPPRNDEHLHTGRLVPVYPETEGLSSKWLRQKIASALPQVLPKIDDPLPEEIIKGMVSLETALNQIHFPLSFDEAQKARERLGFDELFYVQLATLKARNEWKNKPSVEPMKTTDYRLQTTEFIQKLPFKLTAAQKKVIDEIMADLSKNIPMNRLVQGEVGSGKTVVAAVIAYLAHLNGLKTLYMAPTEILAFQHHKTLTQLLEPFGISVGIYTGSRKNIKNVIASPGSKSGVNSAKQSQGLKTGIASSPPAPRNDESADIIVGTHALLSDKLDTSDVGLVIVDEQQRFGVEQRSLLRSKAKVPHFLTMTATPIPRTIALTLYGDLDISIIDELPVGRQKISTHVVPNKKRDDAYKFIAKNVKEGGQVYIITPLIELSETLASAKAATVEFERLQKKIFPDLKLGLLHGRLKSKEKEQVLNDFKDGKIQILVSTTVVEVGVDVQNATILVLESAERFGLAQIHQLRGRVGRGSKQSYALLFSDGDPNAVSRLKNLEKIDNGLKLAELDLKIRGAGQLFGTMQSGRVELKIASFSDLPLIEKSREAAKKILEESTDLEKYPKLKAKLSNIQGQVSPD